MTDRRMVVDKCQLILTFNNKWGRTNRGLQFSGIEFIEMFEAKTSKSSFKCRVEISNNYVVIRQAIITIILILMFFMSVYKQKENWKVIAFR